MKLKILNAPLKAVQYEKHVGLVDKDFCSIGTVATRGSKRKTIIVRPS